MPVGVLPTREINIRYKDGSKGRVILGFKSEPHETHVGIWFGREEKPNSSQYFDPNDSYCFGPIETRGRLENSPNIRNWGYLGSDPAHHYTEEVARFLGVTDPVNIEKLREELRFNETLEV